jgi:hypothetical protein
MKSSRCILSSVIILFLLALSGCGGIPKDALILTPDTIKERQIQSRYYDTTDEEQIIAASAAVLQDLGFTLDKSETKLGFLVASKDRDATSAGQIAGAIVYAMLTGVALPTDKNQKIRVAIIISPSLDEKRTHVRVKFQRKVWNTRDQVSKVETINDPEIYQEFFSKLSKSVFLEANNI